jgi:hypothetical protein
MGQASRSRLAEGAADASLRPPTAGLANPNLWRGFAGGRRTTFSQWPADMGIIEQILAHRLNTPTTLLL